MLLRASGDHDGRDYALKTMTHGEAADRPDGGVPDGAVLIAFAEAVLGDDDDRLAAARDGLRAGLGDAALADTAAVVATFNGVDRVADATGTPLETYKEEATAEMRTALGLDAYVHQEN